MGVPCGGERWAKSILIFNLALVVVATIALLALVVWDLTTGNQAVTGRCVWAGFCLWIGCLTSVGVCVIFLAVNLLALSGIARASSWHNEYPERAYQLLYPWLTVYFFFNIAILPIGIVLIYLWHESAPASCEDPPSFGISSICQEDILNLWAPLTAVIAAFTLAVSLHNWLVLLRLASSLKEKMQPPAFTRIGSRVVLGLLDTSHGDSETKSSTVGRSSTLVGRVTPGGLPWSHLRSVPKHRATLSSPGESPWQSKGAPGGPGWPSQGAHNKSWSPLVGGIAPHQAPTYF